MKIKFVQNVFYILHNINVLRTRNAHTEAYENVADIVN